MIFDAITARRAFGSHVAFLASSQGKKQKKKVSILAKLRELDLMEELFSLMFKNINQLLKHNKNQLLKNFPCLKALGPM